MKIHYTGEDHILTIYTIIIMTTSEDTIKTITVDDLCKENDIYCFECNSMETKSRVAALSVFAVPVSFPCDRSELDKAVAEYTKRTILPILARRIWLFVTTGWHYPNRITKYKKLWKMIKTEQESSSSFSLSGSEIELTRDGMTCYAGLAEVPTDALTMALHTLRKNSVGFIILMKEPVSSPEEVVKLFDAAYPDGEIYEPKWQKLSYLVNELGGITVRLVPVMDTPPYPFASAIDIFLPHHDLERIRQHSVCLS